MTYSEERKVVEEVNRRFKDLQEDQSEFQCYAITTSGMKYIIDLIEEGETLNYIFENEIAQIIEEEGE